MSLGDSGSVFGGVRDERGGFGWGLKCAWIGKWLSCADGFGMVVFGSVVEDVVESTGGSEDRRTALKGS